MANSVRMQTVQQRASRRRTVQGIASTKWLAGFARGPWSDGATALDFGELNCVGDDVTICNYCVVTGSDDAGTTAAILDVSEQGTTGGALARNRNEGQSELSTQEAS